MAEAAKEGAGKSGTLMRADEVESRDLIAADGYLFVCPENLASMSGAMKEMFDRNYYPVLGRLEGRPFASIIAAGSDGEGAQRQLDRICTGWRLRRVADPMIVNFAADTPEAIMAEKQVPAKMLKSCSALGLGMAEGLSLGIY